MSEKSEMCVMYPDGAITSVDKAINIWEDEDFFRNIFDNSRDFLRASQLGVCIEGNFVPVSQMLGRDELFKDHAMAIRDLGIKVKKLERDMMK